MKDRRKGERRSFTWDRIYPNHTFYGERRKTIIKAGRRANTKDRRGSCRCELCLCREVKNLREKDK